MLYKYDMFRMCVECVVCGVGTMPTRIRGRPRSPLNEVCNPIVCAHTDTQQTPLSANNHSDQSLIAVATSDGYVQLIDMHTALVQREMFIHTCAIKSGLMRVHRCY
jgi:hypothetical protein